LLYRSRFAEIGSSPRENSFLKPSSSTYNPALHYFLLFAAAVTFVLLIAGALVTSNQAGLSVPDWPTSFGSLYRMPPMVGGVKFEHGHRMLAEFVGLLTIIAAIWTFRAETRSWMKLLGVFALIVVIAQGVLGGITVLLFLPWAVSTAHATLAQTFFCIIVSMALFTSRSWTKPKPESQTFSETSMALSHSETTADDPHRPALRTLAIFSVASVYVQLILGAAFRHSGIKLLPHLISAAVVTVLLLWTCRRALAQSSPSPDLRRSAKLVLMTLSAQLLLGFAAYLTRVRWGADAPQPLAGMVISTVAHVAVGALLLAETVVLAVQSWRHPTTAEDSVDENFEAKQAMSA
jgi:heme a synthase